MSRLTVRSAQSPTPRTAEARQGVGFLSDIVRATEGPFDAGPTTDIAEPTVAQAPQPTSALIIGAASIAFGSYRRRISR
jgi:hypothetical protein